ncbi:MAG: hypothetical protein U9R75_04885 [Candidatus Thermoplasmatota archaeon]|nr:hypothetical protein [Candidatus Thermoplasmatota archaeon]
MGMWDENQYVIKQKVLTIGRKYFLENGSGQSIGFCKQKLFKLKEDIRIYTDDSMTRELLLIKQEQILDWSGTFRVTDAQTGEVVGFVGRKALKSIIRDTWKLFDPSKNEIATVEERGSVFAVLRRFISFLRWIPKRYDFSDQGGEFAEAVQKFQIIGDTWTLNLTDKRVDSRLILTAALMMDIVEQQQGR